MANIKQQISDFRKSTPRHIQWLLLAAAFIVVLILLTLLFTGRQNAKILPDEGAETKLTFSPGMLDLGKTPVGEKKEEKVAISATNSIQILNITYAETVEGFKLDENCTKLGKIDNRPAKCIFVTYAPTKPMTDKKIMLAITWRPEDAAAGIKHTEEYSITLGATGDAIADSSSARPVVTKPEIIAPATIEAPKVDNKQKIDDDIFVYPNDDDVEEDDDIFVYSNDDEDEDEDLDMTPPAITPPAQSKPVANEIRNDIKAIAPSDPFAGAKNSVATNDTPSAPEACSDFAIPGYGTNGRQIGWIKPERGAYYFHPFSDTKCNNPTGIYNPDNGIITDIKSNGKRIGTDAEHIGYSTITNGTLPKLSNPATKKASGNAKYYSEDANFDTLPQNASMAGGKEFMNRINLKAPEITKETYMGSSSSYVLSSRPYDRQFILRQYKPIPATIVSEVRADPSVYSNADAIQLPVRATVDRNVYADDGRNVILPTGTLMLGYVTGKLPGPYTAVGRMQIKWYQFILPNGVEFNFAEGQDPISADSQGRMGVPGRGSTDYMEQFVMPMLTAIVPAAVNMIAPVADKFVNQIDLDNNTVVQSGTMRSSELAKNEIITAWNQVANKLLVDMMDNTTPPFSIAAGTRITVYSPDDLIVSCGTPDANGNMSKKCALGYSQNKRRNAPQKPLELENDGSWIGQVRSFNWQQYCEGYKDGKLSDAQARAVNAAGLDYSSVLFYCQSNQYKAINNAKQEAYYQNQAQQFQTSYGTANNQTVAQQQAYNQDILGLTYEDSGAIVNPFAKPVADPEPEQPATIGCLDGTQPDSYGCCTGEVYTDMGAEGFACCPSDGGDCFPPIL
ncbi:MAG: hypothetical protein K2M34_03675 [Alphaproteobacteria bacterium]|nr:hypothetical protein [Alphaproteobacteria bacterium]